MTSRVTRMREMRTKWYKTIEGNSNTTRGTGSSQVHCHWVREGPRRGFSLGAPVTKASSVRWAVGLCMSMNSPRSIRDASMSVVCKVSSVSVALLESRTNFTFNSLLSRVVSSCACKGRLPQSYKAGHCRLVFFSLCPPTYNVFSLTTNSNFGTDIY